MAFVEGGEVSVVLNYGTESDWVRNVQAAGSAEVMYRGKGYRLTDPRVVPIDSPDRPPAVRPCIRAQRSTWHSDPWLNPASVDPGKAVVLKELAGIPAGIQALEAAGR